MENVFDDARVSGDAKVYGDASVSGNARVAGNAWVYGNAVVSGNAMVSGNAKVYGSAKVSDDARVSGNAKVYGSAVIQSNDDWFSFIYNGKILTGYRSRNESGYELNIDGEDIAINEIENTHARMWIGFLINGFTPFENTERDELKSVISDLKKQLEEAKNRLKEI